MAIRDTAPSDLPTPTRQGRKPSSHPLLVNLLAEAWYAKYLASGKDTYLPAIEELPYRASLASLRCDRQLFYRMVGADESNPNGIADAWRFELGHFVGDGIAELFNSLGLGWFGEWNVDLRGIGIEGSAHADMVQLFCAGACDKAGAMTWMEQVEDDHAHKHPDYAGDTRRDRTTGEMLPGDALGNPLVFCPECEGTEYAVQTVAEVKTRNGFGFKKMATDFKGAAEGPPSGYVLQGAMAAKALHCSRLIVALFSLENLSVDLAKQFTDSEIGRFAAEWHFDVNSPGITDMLDAERARIARLLKHTQPGMPLPTRELNDPEYPVGAVVVNPHPQSRQARWELRDGAELLDSGTTWMCGYCAFLDKCRSEGEAAVEQGHDGLF